jgi:hypothetical protein
MYGQGVGDCFLLAFPRTRATAEDAAAPARRARPVYVLIDCGVVGGTPGGPQRMRQIVRDIRETTQDEALRDAAGRPKGHLDLLIVTHEHWDHVSGFIQAADEWQRIQVDALWLAWTEQEDASGLPGVLKKILEKQRHALAEAANRALRFGLGERYPRALSLMSFLADAENGLALAAGVHDAFQAAKALVPAEQRAYCAPGEVRPLPGTDAVAYVLGPPRSDERLRQINPSRRAPEAYTAEPADGDGARDAAGGPARPAPAGGAAPDTGDVGPSFSLQQMVGSLSPFNAFAMPLLAASLPLEGAPAPAGLPAGLDLTAERDVYERSFPFDRSLRVPLPVAETETATGPGDYPALGSYFAELNHWRRIDFDWLAAAEVFALQADNLTNNTSLVLAFELPPAADGAERKVLLFTGDAQVGSWLSWDEIPAWQPVDGARPAQSKPDVADLLRRTVLYKVGHHGSHNGTLKARGVERMRTDGALAAVVPVSPKVARAIKDWCQMPLDALLDALSQRAAGRIVLPNGNVWPPVAPEQVAQARVRAGVEVSAATLPPIVQDDQEVEGPVPLWVQLAIDY